MTLSYHTVTNSVECVDTWGYQCENECDCSRGTARCDPVTGCTECLPGWLSNHGYGCDVSC